jgi:RimJ/RimL family protein N-acetyltransferase
MYEKDVLLRDQSIIHLRSSEKHDFGNLWTMLSTLSEQSRHFLPNRFTQDELKTWMENIDYDKLLPIVAVTKSKDSEKPSIVALATLGFQQGEARRHKAEFDIIVHDSFQGKGLGTILTKCMVDIARERGLKKVYLKTDTRNERAIHVYEKLGFKIEGKLIKEHFHYLTQKYCDDYRMAILL